MENLSDGQEWLHDSLQPVYSLNIKQEEHGDSWTLKF